MFLSYNIYQRFKLLSDMKDITTDLFKVKSSVKTPTAGSMLVAEPFMRESYFNHGVVSLIDYVADEGATGVVMNNRTEYMLADLLEGIDNTSQIPVFCGGPLGQDRLYFLHTLGGDIIPNARRYAPGIYVGGDFDAIISYVNSGYPIDGAVRFFIGYSNWAEGQLERELRQESWVLAPSPGQASELLSDVGDRYWHRAVRSLGPAYRAWSLLPRNVIVN